MLRPFLPFEWDPPASDWEGGHFIFTEIDAGQVLAWPLTGVSLIIPTYEHFSDSDAIAKANPNSFSTYENYGYSIGNFHEFLLLDRGAGVRRACFKMGSVEITFGDATPLAVMLFDDRHREKYFGSWSDITSLRIIGCAIDHVEEAYVTALSTYADHFHTLPEPFQIDDSIFYTEEDETMEENEIIEIRPPISLALLPQRFFFLGLKQSDDISACIYFYRVLEYFSAASYNKAISAIRHDATISDANFSKQIVALLGKDEKGPIFALLATQTSKELLSEAHKEGLTGEPKLQQFSESLYSFRNSIVHGKHSYGYNLQSESILTTGSAALKWRHILRRLSRRCIDELASKLL